MQRYKGSVYCCERILIENKEIDLDMDIVVGNFSSKKDAENFTSNCELYYL